MKDYKDYFDYLINSDESKNALVFCAKLFLIMVSIILFIELMAGNL